MPRMSQPPELTGSPRDPAAEALVHPPETSVSNTALASLPDISVPYNRFVPDHLPGQDISRTFRHSGWKVDRLRVYQSLCRTGVSQTRIERYAACGDSAFVYRSTDDPDLYRIAGSGCRDRFCLPCTQERARAIARNVHAKLEGKPARFVTLTIRTHDLELPDAITKLQKAFRRLQQSNLWRERVTGGCAFVEVKYNPDAHRWHPHVHAIVQGRYIPHDLLSKQWLHITGDSFVVRLQLIRSLEHITRYVTTYCAKTLRTRDFPTDHSLDEAILALKGRRLCRTFGTWRGTDLTAVCVEGHWEVVDSLRNLLELAVNGDDHARYIIASLRTKEASQFLHDHPAKPPPLHDNKRPSESHPHLWPDVYSLQG